VLLRLRQRPVASLPHATTGKLKQRYFEPYRIIELINEVAVRLALPPQARLHDVFHVGLLKKFHDAPPEAPPPLPLVHHGAITPEPERAVRQRVARGVQQILVQWKGQSPASATWEDIEPFRAKYPALQLEDELPLEEGRDVLAGRYDHTYTRRCRDMRRAVERAARTADAPDEEGPAGKEGPEEEGPAGA
jgi:hypothetical protein